MEQRRNLEANGFAATGGKYDERITPREHGGDCAALLRAEVGITEVPREYLACGIECLRLHGA